MPFEIVTNFLIFVFGVVLAIQDWRFKEVHVIWVLGFFVSCLLDFMIAEVKFPCLYPFFIFIAIGLIYQLKFHKKAFGLADYIIAFSISFILPDNMWPLFLTVSGVFGIITGRFYKKDTFPFIPSMMFSLLLTRVVAYY